MQEAIQQIRENLPEMVEYISAQIANARIDSYAESLRLSWDATTQLPDTKMLQCLTCKQKIHTDFAKVNDKCPNKDCGGTLVKRLWEQDFGKLGKITMPYAHKQQRQMTYPWENPEALWKHINAIYYCAFAGNQLGKSVMLTAWIVMECLGIHPLQSLTWRRALELCGKTADDFTDRPFKDIDETIRPKPPMAWWVVGTELPSEARIKTGEDTALVKTFYEWCPREAIQFYRKDKIMEINNSVVKWFSHDQEARKLKGDRVDGIGFDEEPPKSFWNEGKPRIIKRKGIFLLAMTSDYGSWTGEIRRQKKDPAYYIGEFDALENPFMPEEQRKKVLGSMSEQELYMRRFGKDISFKGKVFPFEWDIHVKKPFEVSNENVTGVIIDWHPAKPIVVTFLQINPQNIWYTFDEAVIEDHIVGTVVQAIRSKLTRPGFTVRVKKYVIDKIAMMDQVQESGQKAKDIVQMFRGFGIYCELGNPSFGPAHTFLCDKMRHREWYVDPSCALHIEQFDTWGAKRYQKGNLEGTLRDQLEVEGNDTCINHVYAYNAGLKWLDAFWEERTEAAYVHPRASRSSRLYGRA